MTVSALGTSVALSGDGLWGAASAHEQVVVFALRGGTWSIDHTIPLPGSSVIAVALDGDGSHLVIGDGGSRSAWLVVRQPTFGEPLRLMPRMDVAGSEFGAAVAIAATGTRIAVGAPGAARVILFDVN